MKYLFVIGPPLILFFSCQSTREDASSRKRRDSLIITHITTEFNLYDNRKFIQQLEILRGDPARQTAETISHEAKINNLHLKSFLFDSQTRKPFVVEVTDEDGHLIALFSFTDEMYYAGNGIHWNPKRQSKERSDSLLRHKINLERNINVLAMKLGLNNSRNSAAKLINTLGELLEMHPVTQSVIKNDLEHIRSLAPLSDSTYHSLVGELTNFVSDKVDYVLLAKTPSGSSGYWKFWIDEHNNNFVIRCAFFSDILYNEVWM